MKETVIAMVIAFVVGNGTAGGAMKYYADHTYISMNAYQQANDQNRVWQLQDRIKAIKRRAAREDRQLSTAEKLDIEELQTEINNIKGN